VIDIEKCPICNTPTASNPISFSCASFEVVQCSNCQTHYHKKYFDKKEMIEYYSELYCYSRDKKDSNPKFSETIFQQRLSKSHRKKPLSYFNDISSKLKILEIGCDAGGTIRHLYSLGHEVTGLDMCPEYVERLKGEGIEVYCTSFDDVTFEKETFDFVVCFEVLEHFINPVENVKKIYDILKKDGGFLFTTPLVKNGFKKFDGKDRAFQLPHFCVYNSTSLKYLLKDFLIEERSGYFIAKKL